MTGLKKITATLMCLLTILMSFGVSPAAVISLAADGTVAFEEDYVMPGKTLTVSYGGTEKKLSYVWYVDGKKISCSEKSYTPAKADEEKFIKAEVYSSGKKLGEIEKFCSSLPVVYIDTEGGAPIVSKEDYIDAEYFIQGNEEFGESYSGTTEIRGRGNSTWRRFPKKAYRLKLSKKADLFGMGKNKHWDLLANYSDETGMRNQLSVEFSEILGAQTNEAVWVDVILNGECLGLYQLYEHTRVDDNRVEVFDWEGTAGDIAEAIAEKDGLTSDDEDDLADYLEENMQWMSSGRFTYKGKDYIISNYYKDLPETVNGGYLCELDNNMDEASQFYTNRGVPIMFKSPEYILTDSVAFSTAKNIIQDFEDAIYSTDKTIKEKGEKISYTELCDVESFVSYWLVNELLFSEFGGRSTYFYKDIDGKIKFGPVWDFDISSDSVNPYWATHEGTWYGKSRSWFDAILSDPYFVLTAQQMYKDNAAEIRAVAENGSTLDKWHDKLQASGVNNSAIWKYSRGFEEDFKALKSWMQLRIDWMEKQFVDETTALDSLGVVRSDALSLSVSDAVKLNDAAYAVGEDAKKITVNVDVAEEGYSAYAYYINGEYWGKIKLRSDESTFTVYENQLTAEKGKNNVIAVRLIGADGNVSAMQCFAVKMSDAETYKLTFDDDGVKSEKYIGKDESFLLPIPQDENKLFEGWEKGGKLYSPKEMLTADEDIYFTAVYKACADGQNVHSFAESEGKLLCTLCSAVKEIEKNYIHVRQLYYGLDNKFYNRYTGEPIRPVITASLGGTIFTEGVHYTVSCKNNVDIGFATYTVKGIEAAGLTGEVSLSYKIIERGIGAATISFDQSKYYYTGNEIIPKLTLTYNGKTLVEGKDYTLSYSDNREIGKGKVTVTGIGNFYGTKNKTFKIVAVPASKLTAKLSLKDAVYNGKTVTPKVTVTNGKIPLKQDTDYTVEYAKERKLPGTYTVKLTFKGNYSGTTTLSFNILPAKVSSLKASSVGETSLKLSWKAVTGANKYEIYSSTDGKKWKKIASTDKISYTVKKLKAGTNYQFKVSALKDTALKGDFSTAIKTQTKTSAPIKLKAVSNTSRTAKLTWKKIVGAEKYIVQYSTDKSFKKNVKTVTVNENIYTAKGLAKSKTVYFRVKAVNSYKLTSAYSKIASVKVK